MIKEDDSLLTSSILILITLAAMQLFLNNSLSLKMTLKKKSRYLSIIFIQQSYSLHGQSAHHERDFK